MSEKIRYTQSMMNTDPAGYQEIEHTADWELHVWAPDLISLLKTAALGMYALSQIKLAPAGKVEHDLSFEALDAEVLLVTFLDELLFLAEHQSLGFEGFDLAIDENYNLTAKLSGTRIADLKKEIKAVTYHNLSIQQDSNGFRVVIVFDV